MLLFLLKMYPKMFLVLNLKSLFRLRRCLFFHNKINIAKKRRSERFCFCLKHCSILNSNKCEQEHEMRKIPYSLHIQTITITAMRTKMLHQNKKITQSLCAVRVRLLYNWQESTRSWVQCRLLYNKNHSQPQDFVRFRLLYKEPPYKLLLTLEL